MPTHPDFLTMAIEMAIDNVKTGNGGPFGAIIVKDGEIIGRGVNTVTCANDPTAHAEVNAIRDACNRLGTFQLEGCILYTSCEPCPMCLGAIYWARPQAVYFAANKTDAARAGFDDAFIYDELEKKHENRSIPFIPLPHPKAIEAFEEWNNKNDRISY